MWAVDTDDIETIRKEKQKIAACDDDSTIMREEKNEDCRMFSGDSISEILYGYTEEGREAFNNDPFPTDYWYKDLTPEKEYPMDPNEIVKPLIGCLFCHREITLKTGCYLFVQLREHYDRDVRLVACSDTCPVAFKGCSVSHCQQCKREYLHDRYDNDVCRLCK